MKFFSFLVAFLFTQCLFAQNNQKIYKGTINEKYPIVMFMDIDGYSATGTYQYQKVGQDLYLAGSMTSRGQVEMKEFDSFGNWTGSFKGNVNGDVFSGVWTSANGKKKFTFYLTEKDETDFELERLKQIARDLQQQINQLENSRH